MRLHFLVEGVSEAALLDAWIPRALPQHQHRCYPHKGKGKLPLDINGRPNPLKEGLLDQLPWKLRAFGRSLSPQTDRVVVLVDADDDDCSELRLRIEDMLTRCEPRPTVAVRIAVEETEAFYLGDRKAIRDAFGNYRSSALRNYTQDSICGTWEIFQRAIGDRINSKKTWAEMMGKTLSTITSGPASNKSRSFIGFYRAIKLLSGENWP